MIKGTPAIICLCEKQQVKKFNYYTVWTFVYKILKYVSTVGDLTPT